MNLLSKGREIDSPFATHEDAAAALDKLLGAGKLGKSESFARSILNAHARRAASGSQLFWIHKLATPPEVKPEFPRIEFNNINLMLSHAISKGLVGPRIRIEGLLIRIGHGGQVIVIRTGPDRKMIGAVTNHELVLNASAHPEDIHRLAELAADPFKVAKIYGDRTGCCMFCSRYLTTAESVGSGYGPICAENYGLPWATSHGAETERRVRKLLKIQEKLADLGHEGMP